MKLWQKIFICTLLLVIAAVDLTAVLLLANNNKLAVQREQQRAASEHEYLAAMMKDNTLYERLQMGTVRLNDEEVADTIRSTFDMDSANRSAGFSLYLNEKRILSNTGLPRETEQAAMDGLKASHADYFLLITQVKSGEEILIASTVKLEGKQYTLVTSSDITEVFTLLDEQVGYVQKMSVICALGAAMVLLLVVIHLLRPLRRINLGTKEIAQGHYEKRLKVKGHDEVAELAANMNVMAKAVQENVEDLKRVAENRRRFIANLAHEMKTPLTSILGFADLLRVQRHISDTDRQDYAGVIVEETKRLRSLSGKLMELITLGNTKLDWEAVELSAMLEEVKASLLPILQKQSIQFTMHVETATLQGDKELLKSLLYNLVDNAIKASQSGGAIELRGKKTNKGYCIEVEDHGIGIAKEELKRITEPFYMVDKSRSRKAGGAGLGLALCMEIAAVHKAKMTIQSELYQGTLIMVHFPEEVLL